MADAVDRAPDDGRIGFPRIDNAMNKFPPRKKGGGRGAKDDGESSRLGLDESKGDDEEGMSERDKEKLLDRIRKRMERCVSAEAKNREAALDDLKFKAGDQWPSGIQATRNAEGRPCLTIPMMDMFCKQITNDIRQNRPGIVINPTGDKGDPEVAKMYSGMVRAIHRDSHADIAYDTGADGAVSNGFGYWRIVTEFEAPDTFDQCIRILRIDNPFTVYLDPDHQEPDGYGCMFGFITSLMPKDEFEEQYPDSQMVNFDIAGRGDKYAGWGDKDNIRVAEYYEVDYKTRTLVALDNGHVGWEDELDDGIKKKIASGSIEIVRERESQERKVHWYKVTALEVLDDKPWAGTEGVPIVKVIGNEINIEGKVVLSGVIRNAKDAQRMYNYWRTLETELIALQPKAPWVIEEGQVEGHENEWKVANTASLPYLSYKGTAVGGTPAPPPQRQQFAGAPAGVEQAIQGAQNDMRATTGIRFDATTNERMIDESGKAIRELRRSGDMGSFHYVDNMARSLRRTGHILIDLIPKIYDRKRIITILREDESEEQIQIDPHANLPMQEQRQPNGKNLKIFNPTRGNYGVTVTIGPSFATKRIEAAENMMNFAKAMPQAAMLIADLIAKNQDWEGADEMAKRLAKAVPPQLLTPDQKDVPPQVQAYMQSQQMQIQQLTQQLQVAAKQLNDQNADRAIDKEKIAKDFEAKLLAIVQKAEAVKAGGGSREGSQFKDMVQGVQGIMSLFKDGEGEKEPEKPQMSDDMMARLDRLEKAMKKPKKLKISRGPDGLISGAEAEYGE